MHLWLLGLHLGLFILCNSAGKMLSYERKCNFKWQNLEKWKIPRNRGRASFRILFAQLKRCLFIGQNFDK